MGKYILYYIPLLCLLVLMGCRKDLCYDHPHNGSLEIQVDWSLLPNAYKKPSGIAVTFSKLPEQTSRLTYNFLPDGGTKSITQGYYRILMANNDYELVGIRNEDNWDEMEAYTAPITHKPYGVAPKNQSTTTKATPRNGISEADLLMVSSEHDNTEIRSLKEGEEQVIVLKPQSRTIPIIIRIPIEDGIQYVAQARGFLSGVSPSVKLVSGVRAQTPADILFQYGSALGGKELRASFSIFGLVEEQVTGSSYTLGLELLLVDGSVLYYEFEVNNQVTTLLRLLGGEIVIKDIERIDPVEPPATGDGFQPSIDGWSDEEIVVVVG